MQNSIIVWFRNDLRLHDHEALYKASQRSSRLVPVFVFDPRWFQQMPLGFRKTGLARTQLLIEAVANLRNNLQRIGSNVIIRIGKPEEILPQLAQEVGAVALYTSEEVASEELNTDQKVEQALQKLGIEMNFYWQSTLFHIDDLPFEIDKLPDVFTQFRNKTEKFAKVRSTFPTPQKLIFDCTTPIGSVPTLADLGFEEPPFLPDSRGVLPFKGGENEAIKRVERYFWESDQLARYKETRNEMLGEGFSSKFSVWLALGCISPRYIYEEVKRYEHERVANDSTYWLIFELIWRDYFRFVALKYGNRLFFREGLMNDSRNEWQENKRIFEQWRLGQTGIPLIDANMRELLLTGFMSNRGRQNVASFLTKDLKINWLWGAEWFESQLLDYDVCSNYGNWQYVAGVGNDPRENRYFNIHTQATRYDAQGLYVKHWLPELSPLPPEKVHLVGLLKPNEQSHWGVRLGVEYPNPLVNPAKWLK